MNRRSSLRILTVIFGAVALLSCAEPGPEPATFATSPQLASTGGKTFTDLALGDFHSCGVQANGEVFCWGLNTQGQSGNGVGGGAGVITPTVVIGGYLFSSISAGGVHTCGLLLVGTTMCWGNNVGGQLGTGTPQDRFEPTPVAGQPDFIQVSASTLAHTCALKANGEVWCWGRGSEGQLGNGSNEAKTTPTLVGGGVSFTSISTGGGHTCGIAADSSAYCWGFNERGQVGDGTNTLRMIPTKVSTTRKFIAIAAGVAHTCALNQNGEPYCWGDNIFGSVGDGTTVAKSVPTQVEGGFSFESLVSGERHTCGLEASGNVMCWGYNQEGSLGDGTLLNRSAPVALVTPLVFKKIAAGAYHTCGITTDNKTYCWGNNYGFQLGVVDITSPPVAQP